MQKTKYLPLGSVVLLHGAIQKLLVIARGIHVLQNGEKLFFDYGGVLYPEGLTGDTMAYFNHDGIAKVIFEGYSDDDSKIIENAIDSYVRNTPNLKRGNPQV